MSLVATTIGSEVGQLLPKEHFDIGRAMDAAHARGLWGELAEGFVFPVPPCLIEGLVQEPCALCLERFPRLPYPVRPT